MHIKIFIMLKKRIIFTEDITKSWTFLNVETSASLRSSTVYCIYKDKMSNTFHAISIDKIQIYMSIKIDPYFLI